jgi:ankyrin repeat protein
MTTLQMPATWRTLILAGVPALLLPAFLMAADAARPPLIDAAKSADRSALRALLDKKADVNAAEADGSTALHWASYNNDLETADVLIRAGANVNAATDLGVTPLWMASENTSAPMVRRLLEAGADPNAKLLAGETPLMVAARSGSPAIVEQLIAKGASVNARGPRGQTPLMWAVAEKHSDVVKTLLARGADIHARSDVWSQMMAVPPHGHPDYNMMVPHGGDTALLFAAREGDLASAKLLVAAGANVNDTDAWGVSATVFATHSGHGELANFLLEKDADPNLAEPGFTALQLAIMHRDEKLVSALLAHGANPNTPLKTWTPSRRSSRDYSFEPALVGATPFWLAARFAQPGVMRLLAERGADPLFVLRSVYLREVDFKPRTEATTALMAAVGMGGGTAWVEIGPAERESLVLETVKLAAELGVDVNAANTDGRTALDVAKARKYETVIRFLEEHGAKTK